MEEIILSGADGNTMLCGEPVNMKLRLHPGEMHPDELLVQLVIGRTFANGNFRDKPDVIRLEPRPDQKGDGSLIYRGVYIPRRNGSYRYGIRVIPVHPGLSTPLETGLILWG